MLGGTLNHRSHQIKFTLTTIRLPVRVKAGNQLTYEVVTGQEGGALQHVKAGGAVAGGAVEFAAAALADVAGGVGNLPAVDENRRVLALPKHSAAGESQVVSWVTVTKP